MVAALWLAVAACMRPTWNEIAAGAAPGHGVVAVVGAVSLIPPVEQQSAGSSRVVLVGAARDRMYAVFTVDLRRPFGPSLWEDASAHESVYLPLEGAFFIEIPRSHPRLYLRGVVIMTNRGRIGVETPVQLSFYPEDDIVYIGHVYVQRTSPRSTQVSDEQPEAREAAQQLGHGALATRPWTVRLARAIELGDYRPSGGKPFEPVPLQAPPNAR
jgi:hypothetical protein